MHGRDLYAVTKQTLALGFDIVNLKRYPRARSRFIPGRITVNRKRG